MPIRYSLMAGNAVSYWFSSPPSMFQSDQLCQGLFTLPSNLQQLFLFHVSTPVYRHFSCLDPMPISYPNLQPNSRLLLPRTQLCSQSPRTLCWKVTPCPPGETGTRFCSQHCHSVPSPDSLSLPPALCSVRPPKTLSTFCATRPGMLWLKWKPARAAKSWLLTSPTYHTLSTIFPGMH